MSDVPDIPTVDVPTDGDLQSRVGKAEISHRNKHVAVRVFYMSIAYLTPLYLGVLILIGSVVALVTVAAWNIPSLTDANTALSDTLASMHPWKVQDSPAWDVQEEATSDPDNPNRYLRATFMSPTLYQRLIDLGWRAAHANLLMRVSVPSATEGEHPTRYYSTWVGTSPPVVDSESRMVVRFSEHNLPPAGPPDGALVSGNDYQLEVRLTMASEGDRFYRYYIITTGWYTHP